MNILIIVSALVLVNISIILLLGRSQGMQRLGAVLLVLTLAIGGCSAFGYYQAKSFGLDQYADMYKLSYESCYSYMQTLETNEEIYSYNSDDTLKSAKDTVESVLPVVTEKDKSYSYINLVLARKDETGVYLSCYDDLQDEGFWKDHYDMASKLIEKSIRNQKSASKVMDNGNLMLAITDKSRVAPSYAMVVEVSTKPVKGSFSEIKLHYYIVSLVAIAIACLLTGLIIFLQDREFKKLLRVLTKVSEGGADYEFLKQSAPAGRRESKEMHTFRSGLWQIASNVEWMNYSKYRVLQAYYRFAPKQIEKIIGRESILDVNPMDRVSMEGTLAFVSFSIDDSLPEQDILHNVNKSYQLLGQVREEQDGLIISSTSDLRVIQLMFKEKTLKALSFGIKLINRELEEESANHAFVLLHRTPFVYGVAGDQNQAFTYVHSNEMRVLERYVEDLKNMGVRMVVTDYVQEIVEKETTTRYIGYIQNGDCTFNLYEVLDALTAGDRQKRIDNKAKFSQALTLYYKSDFYLARNLFSEILRSCPTDAVAKWYLFLCESSLNGQASDRQSYALFPEK